MSEIVLVGPGNGFSGFGTGLARIRCRLFALMDKSAFLKYSSGKRRIDAGALSGPPS